jgi:hypothetical protein
MEEQNLKLILPFYFLIGIIFTKLLIECVLADAKTNWQSISGLAEGLMIATSQSWDGLSCLDHSGH